MSRFSPWPAGSLEAKFVRRFLPALTVVLFIACVICLLISRQQLTQTAQKYGEQAAIFATRTLRTASSESLPASHRQLVHDLEKDPAIAAVRLTNQQTGEKWTAGELLSVPFEGGPKLTRDVVIERDPPAPALHFHLEIWMHEPSLLAVVQHGSGQMIVLGTVALAAFLVGLFLHRQLVARPLRSFREAIAAHGGSSEFFEADEVHDELGTTLQAYHALSRHRLATQKELLVSQERLRILSDNLPNAFLYQNRIDPNGTISFSFVGESVREVLGVTPDEVYRNPGILRNKIDPGYIAEMRQAEEQAVRRRAEFSYECPYLFPDGSRHWVQFLSRPSQMPDGEYLWQGVFIDVTEAREKDAALQQSRADARAILNALPDPIFVNPWPTRREGAHFTHVNPSACEFLGMTEAELLAVGPGQVDDLSPEEIQRIRSSLQKDGRLRFETTFIRKDGRRFPGELCSCVIEFGGRSVSVSVARSLEDQKKRESEMRKAAEQIAADRAIIAQKNIELSQLLHILCHDLANPISVLNGRLNLQKGHPRPDLSECSEISQQVLDLIGIVNKLQGFEGSKQSLALETVSAKEMAGQAVQTLRSRLEAKQLRAEINIPDNLLITVERTSFLNSVLANILTNAIKFSDPGHSIQITGRSEDGRATLEIKDHGIGIPQELLQKLFDPAERTTRQGTAGEIGTGFGMPLVKKFMELYGGEIHLSSFPIGTDPQDPGTRHGTTVLLILPLAPAVPPHFQPNCRKR